MRNEVLTIEQAADALFVSPTTIEAWIVQGVLPTPLTCKSVGELSAEIELPPSATAIKFLKSLATSNEGASQSAIDLAKHCLVLIGDDALDATTREQLAGAVLLMPWQKLAHGED